MRSRSRSSILSVALALCLSASCAGPKAPAEPPRELRAEVTGEVTLAATVSALDPARRLLVLRDEDGGVLELVAGPAVRDFERIALGDTLRVRYQERLSALRLPADASLGPAEAAFAAGRAAPGEGPAAGAAAAVRLRVRIESIDTQRAIVVFAPASGRLIAHRLRTAEGRAFVEQLRVGDLVELEYGERVALDVDRRVDRP
jgi:hypothetical protein